MKNNRGIWIIPAVYTLVVFLLIFGLYLTVNNSKELKFEEPKNEKSNFVFEDQVRNEMNDIAKPVISAKEVSLRPYNNDLVTIGKYYYSYESTTDQQEESIHNYKSKYFQNRGVDYSSESTFEVNAFLKGTVLKVKDDVVFGKVIEIVHEDNVLSSYSSLSEVFVSEGDEVTRGQKIGLSGNNQFLSSNQTHLHFEVRKGLVTIDPETSYNKSVSEIGTE